MNFLSFISNKKIFLFVGGALFLIGIAVYVFYLPRPFVSSDYSSFDIVSIDSSQNSDQKIIGVLVKNGKVVTIIRSVRKVSGIPNFEVLEKIASIPESKKIVMLQSKDTFTGDKTPGVLWEWNGQTGTLQKMALNKIYTGFGAIAVSPNQKFIAYIDAKERKSIHLFDLIHDTDRIVTTAPQGIILTNGKQVKGYKIGWVDDITIEYGTYDETNLYDESLGAYSPIGTTRVFIDLPCADSDGGDNIYKKGTLDGIKSVDGNVLEDFCPSGNVLLECSCSLDGGFSQNNFGMFSKSVPCEYGCSAGACNKKP